MKRLIRSLCTTGLMAAASINTAAAQSSTEELTKQPTTGARVVGACRFRVADMYGGRFEVFTQSSPAQGGYLLPTMGPKAFLTEGFGLFCVDATEERVASSLNGKYVDGRWWTFGPVDGPEFVPYEQQAKARTIPLKEKNWTGIAYTEDATTGDERTRARVFHFCLVHDAHALCGYTPVKWLADRKRRSDLDRIKAILESIEFINAPTTDDAASGATTTNK